MILFDIDSTLFDTFGSQKGEGFNYHYLNHGYHPLLCYDGLTGDLLKAMLRPGVVYTSSDCCEFMKSLLMEYLDEYPDIALYLRGDSGFACPELFELNEITAKNKVDYAVVYGEFRYTAATWGQTRRIVVKVEKPAGQLTFMYTYIVTNMDMKPEDTIRFYCNRGKMENFIKE